MTLKDLMQARNINANQLAYATKIPPQRIGEYIKGTRDLREARVRTALSIMEALGTDDIRELLND